MGGRRGKTVPAAGERLWLLQARPVTTLPRPGWPETAALPRYWSTANLKDSLPGVICELSWSILSDIVGEVLWAAPNAVGYQIPPGMEVVRRFQGRGYFDLTMMQWAFYDSLGILPADVVKVVGGHQPEIPVPPNPLKGPMGRRRALAGLRLLRRIAFDHWTDQAGFSSLAEWSPSRSPTLLVARVAVFMAQDTGDSGGLRLAAAHGLPVEAGRAVRSTRQ